MPFKIERKLRKHQSFPDLPHYQKREPFEFLFNSEREEDHSKVVIPDGGLNINLPSRAVMELCKNTNTAETTIERHPVFYPDAIDLKAQECAPDFERYQYRSNGFKAAESSTPMRKVWPIASTAMCSSNQNTKNLPKLNPFPPDLDSSSGNKAIFKESRASRQLDTALECAKRDPDFLIVLLERVVSCTQQLYNNQSTNCIDSVCISLADSIRHYTQAKARTRNHGK